MGGWIVDGREIVDGLWPKLGISLIAILQKRSERKDFAATQIELLCIRPVAPCVTLEPALIPITGIGNNNASSGMSIRG
jgi:hypothetical protein